MKIAKTIVGAIALAASTGLGFLPHDDPWFNVLTAVVAIAGAYGVYQIPNKKPTPRQQAIGAAVGVLAEQGAAYVPGTGEVPPVIPVYQPPAGTPTE